MRGMRRRVPIVLLIMSLLMGLFSTGCAELAPAIQEASEIVEFEIIEDDEDAASADDAASETAEEIPAEEPMPEEVEPAENDFDESVEEVLLKEEGSYNSKEDVALYLYTYGHLPSNYMTKKEAQDLGWSGGSLEKYAPGMSIGGSKYGNYEGLLPDKKGRTWKECDIDTQGKKSRGAKRIVWSNDGLIYYTDDHYESFELLYGNP